jgi:hypothetical protein
MIDDTSDPNVLDITSSELAKSIEEISNHKISRLAIRGWTRSLRFLTYDDNPDSSDTENVNATINPRQLCGRCERGTSLPAGHQCFTHLKEPALPIGKPVTVDACSHIARLTCNFCKDIPLFPSQGKVTRFRIRRVVQREDAPTIMRYKSPEETKWNPKDHNEFPCGHFVAVSYSWAAQNAGSSSPGNGQKPYKVMEEDGSVRDMRASTHTIDRIVAFAAENGYRMLWIDQVRNLVVFFKTLLKVSGMYSTGK